MFLPSTALFLAMAILPNGGTAKEPVAKGPYELRGQVLDVFGNNQFLLSIGTDQGARTGLKGILSRTDSEPAMLMVEFVEVGAKHSVVRGTFFANILRAKDRQLKTDDTIVWFSLEPFPIPEMPRRLEIRVPGYFPPGGAIIDLTTPNGAKMLPRMK